MDDGEPSPIRPNPDASQPPGGSFYNDSSLVYEEFAEMTPQQVRAAQAQRQYAQPVTASAPPKSAVVDPGHSRSRLPRN